MKELVININNSNDIKKFYKKIRFYKLFKNKYKMKLNISNKINSINKEELNSIEKAFNIKDKDERLMYVYLATCDFIDKHYIEPNYCEFDEDGHCSCQRAHKEKVVFENGCCGKCPYLGDHGCTIKSIACKIFYCSYARKRHNIFRFRDLNLPKYFFTPQQKVIAHFNFFSTPEENVKIMKKNSLLYYALLPPKDVKRY